MNTVMRVGTVLLLSQLIALRGAIAQHPIEVQRLAASGEYFVALTTYEKMPKRIATSESIVAAARSAWALGLASRAIEEFDRALRDEKLPEVEKARIYLSKGIIEYQEAHYQVATLHAERAVKIIQGLQSNEPSPLRAKANLLWADSLTKLGSFGDAEEKYSNAIADGSQEDLPQMYFSRGKCRLQLGKYEDARKDFELVPLGHDLTADSIRNLASIALDTGKYTSAAFWLNKGRAEYADNFLDSWVDYALLRVAVSQDDVQSVRDLRSAAIKKYPPSDPWLTLLQAAAESYEWSKTQPSAPKEG